MTYINQLEKEIDRLEAELATKNAHLEQVEAELNLARMTLADKMRECVRLAISLHHCLAGALELNDSHDWPVSRLIREQVKDTNSTAIVDLLAPIMDALEHYAVCGDGCTCGDGWNHDVAREALAQLKSITGGKT